MRLGGRGTLGSLNVIWDNAPARRGEAVREYLRRPGLASLADGEPAFSRAAWLCRATVRTSNADEAVWGWAREEAHQDILCPGTKALVQQTGSATSSTGFGHLGEPKS